MKKNDECGHVLPENTSVKYILPLNSIPKYTLTKDAMLEKERVAMEQHREEFKRISELYRHFV